MKLAIDLAESQVARLRTEAERLGVPMEDLALAAIRDLLGDADEAFSDAASRVLEKNRELYERLA